MLGLDLTICLIPNGKMDWWLCHNRVNFQRDYDFFSRIADTGRRKINPSLNPLPVPESKRVDWYDDDGIKQTTEDAYGSKLTYLLASAFSKVTSDNQWNKAILEMLKLLPEDTPIILYWC